MPSRIALTALAAVTFQWACAGVTAPSIETAEAPLVVADGTLHHLQWNAASGPAETAGDGALSRGPFLVAGVPAHTASPLPLETFEVTFRAARGRYSHIAINYANCPRSSAGRHGDDYRRGRRKSCPFLRLDIPSNSLHTLPSGTRIGWGESVAITVSVNKSQILVNLEPSGLQFNARNKATLTIWYGGANPDFNGDGVVDDEDALIEREQLRLWYQDEHGGPWYEMDATHYASERKFKVKLPHFSGYAVSW